MKKIAVILVVLAMFFSVVPRMALIAEGGSEGWEEERVYLDAEVRMIDNQLVLAVEREKEYINNPIRLPESVMFNSQIIPLKMQEKGVIIPTEDGPVVVPFEDFEVVMINGELTLLTEVNPTL